LENALDEEFPSSLPAEQQRLLYRALVSDIVGRRMLPGAWIT